MSLFPTVDEQRYAAAYEGNYLHAKSILYDYGLRHCQWSRETLRARWDGAAALMDWWHAQEPFKRPPLDDLQVDDARAFISTLECKGLARTTIKSYRTGASALTKAIRWSRGHKGEYPVYDPFKNALPAPIKRKVPQVDRMKLEALGDERTRAKLEALLTLLNLGLGIPEACTLYWSDVNLEKRELTRYHKKHITIHTEAIQALKALWSVLPKAGQSRGRRIFGWSADTARRWLKVIRVG